MKSKKASYCYYKNISSEDVIDNKGWFDKFCTRDNDSDGWFGDAAAAAASNLSSQRNQSPLNGQDSPSDNVTYDGHSDAGAGDCGGDGGGGDGGDWKEGFFCIYLRCSLQIGISSWCV